jgi:hypothetical protein
MGSLLQAVSSAKAEFTVDGGVVEQPPFDHYRVCGARRRLRKPGALGLSGSRGNERREGSAQAWWGVAVLV